MIIIIEPNIILKGFPHTTSNGSTRKQLGHCSSHWRFRI